jgi:hypothetical protein
MDNIVQTCIWWIVFQVLKEELSNFEQTIVDNSYENNLWGVQRETSFIFNKCKMVQNTCFEKIFIENSNIVRF